MLLKHTTDTSMTTGTCTEFHPNLKSEKSTDRFFIDFEINNNVARITEL